jgi:hypothetical protein
LFWTIRSSRWSLIAVHEHLPNHRASGAATTALPRGLTVGERPKESGCVKYFEPGRSRMNDRTPQG